MTRNRVQIELDLESRQAQRDLGKVADAARDAGDELEGAETAAQAVARAIQKGASDAESELHDTIRVVDRLTAALGETDNQKAHQVIAQYKRFGLTAQEVEEDLDEVVRSVRAMDDVNLQASRAGFDDISHAVGGVDQETRRARDTMTGFTGGMIGELPVVADALGPVGEGLGQLTEGALEGEINFKQLLTAGLAMGGAVLVLDQLNSRLNESAEIEAFQEEQIESYTDALEDADTVLEGVVNRLRAADELEFKIGGGIEFEVTRRDLLEVGLTAERAAELIEGGAEDIEAWGQAAQQAGVDSDKLSKVALVLIAESKFLADSMEAQAVATEFFGDAADEASESTDRQVSSTKKLTDAVSDVTRSVADAIEAEEELTAERQAQIETTRELLDLEIERIDSQRAAVDATFALRDAEDDFTKAKAEANEQIKDADGDLRKVRQAMDDAATSAAKLADAEIEVARETARANGQTFHASQELDVFNRSMLESARSAEGPLRDAILEYVASVNKIPDHQVTQIAAAIERGDLDEANRLLNNASRARRAIITAQANVRDAEGSLNYTGRPREVLFYARTVGDLPSNPRGPNVAFSRGTRGAPPHDLALVGEQGPEFVRLPTGSQVSTAEETRRMLGSGGQTTVIHNWPAGVHPRDVAQADRRYRRIQGDS